MTLLVTGAAGFIGYHVCAALLARGDRVVGIDNLNDYYSVQLKRDRLALLAGAEQFQFIELDVADRDGMAALFAEHKFERVIHLAAQAGVRYSIDNPLAYIDSNLTGFGHVLEGCRHNGVQHLTYASSSSVYGANACQPFSESHNVDHPMSLYAATKKANELMAHTYSNLYDLPTTGLRFFTVYGPWGRPDMALFKFTRAILAGEPIDLYNGGDMVRDFTYIDDICRGVLAASDQIAAPAAEFDHEIPDPGISFAPYRIYNIGAGTQVKLGDFVNAIEAATGKTAHKRLLPMQPGDVPATWADTSALDNAVGFAPTTSVGEGVAEFVGWYRRYYHV